MSAFVAIVEVGPRDGLPSLAADVDADRNADEVLMIVETAVPDVPSAADGRSLIVGGSPSP